MITKLRTATWIALALALVAIVFAGAMRDSAAPALASTSTQLCAGHGADAASCFLCDPALRDASRLWCNEHARYEDRCFLCHPEIRDPDRLYCNEHGVYEDECVLCHPELARAGAGATTPSAGDLYCVEHDLAEKECGICHPELADGLAPGGALKIRLPSAASAAKAGVSSQLPTPAERSQTVAAMGEVSYDLNRLAKITPMVEGVVREVHVDVGDRVRAGEALLTLTSQQVAAAKAEYLTTLASESAAVRTLEREQELFGLAVSAERDLDTARAELAAVRAQRIASERALIDLGFTAEGIGAIERGESSGSKLTLLAPLSGTVVARDVVMGDVVSVGQELLRVAHLDEMWVKVAVPEHEVAAITIGQAVEVRSDATGHQTRGVVTWVASELDATTRTALVRAAIANPAGQWKAGMFVDVRITIGAQTDALAIPSGAVHYFGNEPFVFVDLTDGLYEVRRVDLARSAPAQRGALPDQERAFVIAGLALHDRVVTERSFLVKSEFQKSRLGAGCVD